MAQVKFVVIYPRPTDIEAFEKLYQDEHVPMAVEKFIGKTKLVATKVLDSPKGTPPIVSCMFRTLMQPRGDGGG